MSQRSEPPTYAAAPGTADDAGFVQVFVIAALLVIAGLMTVMLSRADDGLRLDVALRRMVVANAIAETVFAARATAFAGGVGDFASNDAVVSGERVSVTVENVGGRISIGNTPLAVIDAYLERVGVDGGARRQLLGQLQLLRDNGDGAAALDALTLAAGPGLPQAQIARDFSLHLSIGTIDASLASETVLAALPDLSGSERADILAARARNEEPPFGLSAYLGNPQPVYAMLVTVHWSDTEHSVRRVPFELTSGGRLRQLAGPAP